MELDICLISAGFMILYFNLRSWRDNMGIWRLVVSFLIFACMVSAMRVWGLPIFAALLGLTLADLFFSMRR